MKISDLEYCEENIQQPTLIGGLTANAFAEVFASGNFFSGGFARAITFSFFFPREN
jgi:hypothetical protein